MDDLTEAQQDEYRQAVADNFPQFDEKGRKNVVTMTDREIVIETLRTLRELTDVLEAVGQSPMAAAIMPGLSRLGK